MIVAFLFWILCQSLDSGLRGLMHSVTTVFISVFYLSLVLSVTAIPSFHFDLSLFCILRSDPPATTELHPNVFKEGARISGRNWWWYSVRRMWSWGCQGRLCCDIRSLWWQNMPSSFLSPCFHSVAKMSSLNHFEKKRAYLWTCPYYTLPHSTEFCYCLTLFVQTIRARDQGSRPWPLPLPADSGEGWGVELESS